MNGLARVAAGSTVGALSDLAISGTTTGVGERQIENAGTVTGFVQFGGGDNSFLNNGRFNLRHFADTNGGGGRDTLRVAIADLGTGPNNRFTNNGTLALPAVTGATTLVSTGQYLPQGNDVQCHGAWWAPAGPDRRCLQLRQQRRDQPSGEPRAWGCSGDHRRPQAGSFGGGNFVANGGSLRLDSVLNDGVPSQSDVLVVDRTSIGANGPTQIAVRNVGGGGDLTPGNGILVVDTPTGGSTQPGTFSLAGPVIAGPYEYSLFRSGINGSTPQSWYLRSTLPAPPEPIPPGSNTAGSNPAQPDTPATIAAGTADPQHPRGGLAVCRPAGHGGPLRNADHRHLA